MWSCDIKLNSLGKALFWKASLGNRKVKILITIGSCMTSIPIKIFNKCGLDKNQVFRVKDGCRYMEKFNSIIKKGEAKIGVQFKIDLPSEHEYSYWILGMDFFSNYHCAVSLEIMGPKLKGQKC